MGLFGFFKKKDQEKKPAIDRREHLDHLTDDGRLPYGWWMANREFTERIDHERSYFFGVWFESRKGPPKDQYAALKSLVMYMDDVRKLCRSKDECFVYWSETMFGDDDFKMYQDKLEYLKENFSDLEEEYYFKEYIKHHYYTQAVDIIRNNPGILQSELYKMLPGYCRGVVSTELYYSGKLIKEKSGRSYSLRIKE